MLDTFEIVIHGDYGAVQSATDPPTDSTAKTPVKKHKQKASKTAKNADVEKKHTSYSFKQWACFAVGLMFTIAFMGVFSCSPYWCAVFIGAFNQVASPFWAFTSGAHAALVKTNVVSGRTPHLGDTALYNSGRRASLSSFGEISMLQLSKSKLIATGDAADTNLKTSYVADDQATRVKGLVDYMEVWFERHKGPVQGGEYTEVANIIAAGLGAGAKYKFSDFQVTSPTLQGHLAGKSHASNISSFLPQVAKSEVLKGILPD